MRLPPLFRIVLFPLAAFCLLNSCILDSKPTQEAPSPPSSREVNSATAPLVISPCDGFDFPVGPPDAKRYYNAQPFGVNAHLGDDWNGTGGGNSDLGDPVHSVAAGQVRFAEDVGPGWGNVVRIVHNIGTVEAPELVESLYGHLDTILVGVGEEVKRGQQVGTIGNADGAYWAHLHFEMRDSLDLPVGGGYAAETAGYLDPTAFIKAHRPAKH